MLFLGIDAGTQGVRAIASDEAGNIAAAASEAYSVINCANEDGFREQSPADWWETAVRVISRLTAELKEKGHSAEEIAALSVDATSGTVLMVDGCGDPIGNGVMYNDARASGQAKRVSAAAREYERKLGYRFNSSYALPKLLWLRENRAADFSRAKKLLHQTDYITGRLCGSFEYTDYSSALKTGCDIVDGGWCPYIGELGIDPALLPTLIYPGEPIGRVSKAAARVTGLSENTVVTGGSTDGYASALSAGTTSVGDWVSIVGTTLVLKGVSRDIIRDEKGRVYCHLLPGGLFFPGGASNVGGVVLNERFNKEDFPRLDGECVPLLPTGGLIYPLRGQGERFPFVDPEAEGFCEGLPQTEAGRFGAYMEGVAYTERLCFELMESLGAEVGNEIRTVGGACKSDIWLKIRASVLGKRLLVPAVTDAALGSALLAARKTGFASLTEAADAMVRIVKRVEPEDKLSSAYASIYGEFRQLAEERYGI